MNAKSGYSENISFRRLLSMINTRLKDARKIISGIVGGLIVGILGAILVAIAFPSTAESTGQAGLSKIHRHCHTVCKEIHKCKK